MGTDGKHFPSLPSPHLFTPSPFRGRGPGGTITPLLFHTSSSPPPPQLRPFFGNDRERLLLCTPKKKGFPFPSLFSAVCFRSSHVNFPPFFRRRSISFPRPPSVRLSLSLSSTESFSSLSSLYQRHYTTTTPLSTRERRFLRPLLLLPRRRRPTRPALIQRRRGRRAEGGGTPSPLSPTRLRQKRTRRRRKEAAAGEREQREKKPPRLRPLFPPRGLPDERTQATERRGGAQAKREDG